MIMVAVDGRVIVVAVEAYEATRLGNAAAESMPSYIQLRSHTYRSEEQLEHWIVGGNRQQVCADPF